VKGSKAGVNNITPTKRDECHKCIYYLTIKYDNNSKQYLAFKKITEGCRVYLYTSKYSRPNRASGNLNAEKQVRPIPLAERESQSRSQETKGTFR
jgi:hypothetical protein